MRPLLAFPVADKRAKVHCNDMKFVVALSQKPPRLGRTPQQPVAKASPLFGVKQGGLACSF